MAWEKKGLIFCPDNTNAWMVSHAQLPTPILRDDVIRLYLMTRDANNKSRVGIVDLDRNDPARVLEVHSTPALDLGVRGGFDDAGVAPSCAVQQGEAIILYYVGITPRVTVSLDYSIGVAKSLDGGRNFERVFDGPVVTRSPNEPFLFTSPFVRAENGDWHMYYTSGTGWADIDGQPEMLYDIKHATSTDGLTWNRDGRAAVAPASDKEVTARPWVIKDNDGYRMWFCFRGTSNFRDGENSYRMGFAESQDGKTWHRDDAKVGISASGEGWDSLMLAYPALLEADGRLLMFYNGNGFGKSGVGYAEWVAD